jgi:hypothetical protein
MEKSYGLQYDIVFWLVHIQEYLSCITLTSQEMQKSNVCVKNFPHDYWKGQHGFWNASEHEIRRTHHKYLVPGKALSLK